MSEGLIFDVVLAREGFVLSMAATVPLSGITAITGPSGSGKTTLLRVLAGLEPGATGRMDLAARVLQGPGTFVPPHLRGIGYVFQEPRLFPHLDVAQNLAYGARRRGVGQGRIDDIARVLDLVPLLTRDTRGLSGGEARRVALGRVLASGPTILFLDEPMTGLDLARKAEILPHIARASQTFDLPALFVSHARDEVLTLADRVMSVSAGRITGWAPPPPRLRAEVLQSQGGRTTFGLAGQHIVLSVAARQGETWSLALAPETALLSHGAPGAHSALACLQCEVRGGDDARLELLVAGQKLWWPRSAALGETAPGDMLWLSVLDTFPRPDNDTTTPRREIDS